MLSESYLQVLREGLEGILQQAMADLVTLTPSPRRGKRQIHEETQMVKATEAMLKAHDLDGLLGYTLN